MGDMLQHTKCSWPRCPPTRPQDRRLALANECSSIFFPERRTVSNIQNLAFSKSLILVMPLLNLTSAGSSTCSSITLVEILLIMAKGCEVRHKVVMVNAYSIRCPSKEQTQQSDGTQASYMAAFTTARLQNWQM